MPASSAGLVWNTPSLQNLLLARSIRSRSELARRIGVSRGVVNLAFDEQWRGRATTALIDRLARYFHVPMNQLVIEPASLSGNGKPRNPTVRKVVQTQ